MVWFKNKGSKSFSRLLIIALLFAHPYLKNFQVFSNPIFPFKSSIPNSFYYFTMDSWQSFCNLIFDIPEGLYQLYLLIHVSLGFGTTLWDKIFPYLPQAGQKGVSLGFLNPLLLSLFLFPFFIKDRTLRFIGLLFWSLFYIWSKVSTYRVLLGLNLFGMIFFVLIFDYFKRDGFLLNIWPFPVFSFFSFIMEPTLSRNFLLTHSIF